MIKIKTLKILFICVLFSVVYSCKEKKLKADVDGWEAFDKIKNIRKETYNKVISYATRNMIESNNINNSSSCKSSFEFKPNQTISLEYCTEEIYWDNDEIGQIHRNIHRHKETGDVTFIELIRGCGLDSYSLQDCYYNGYSEFSLNGKWKSRSAEDLNLIINASIKENKINFFIFSNNNNWVHRKEIKVQNSSHFDNIIYSGKRKIDSIRAVEEVKNAKEIYFEGIIQHTVASHGQYYIIVKVTKGKLKGDKEKTFHIITDMRENEFKFDGFEILDPQEYNKKIPVKGKVYKAIGKFENYEYLGYDIKAVYKPSCLEIL